MSRYQLDNAALEAYRDIAGDVDESAFVPYACLFDANTILTKNGELLQILKITGFTYEAIEHEDADLRQVIRDAVGKGIPNDDYALWFTTIRRKKNLSPDGSYPDEFSHTMHEAWKQRNGWDRKYINELYVTIVHDGQTAAITNPQSFLQGIFAIQDRNQRNRYLDKIGVKLNQTVERILELLQSYGARRLSTVKREDGCYYGEHLEFLEKLINLEERPMPLVEVGLADYLTSGEISFAYNAMEVRSAEGERRFGAVLTVKEYKEASLNRLDQILQLPCEFIVTQCLSYVDAAKAQQSFKDQHYFMKLGGDQKLIEQTELSQMLARSSTDAMSFAQQQTTVFMIADSVKSLDHSVQVVRDALSRIGIISVREDIRFEDTYWAMLPANFEFISRLNYINVRHVAGFANLQNYPAGNAAGCPWGPPVTVFYTAAGTPYFFNFHLGQKGHTMLAGPLGSGKSVLLNFLLSESRKYQNRLFYLDAHGHAAAFVRAIGGNYYAMDDVHNAHHHLGPLSLADNAGNRDFLKLWVTTLIDPYGQNVPEAALPIIKSAIDQLYGMAPEQRSLELIVHALHADYPQLASELTRWYGQGEWAHYFDHIDESVEPKGGVIGFNLQGVIHDPNRLVPLASYLLHRITMTFDGTPSILVLDEAWRLLNSPMFAPRLGQWLDYVASKNAVVIMTTEEIEEAASMPFCKTLIEHTPTQIFLPDEEPVDAYEEVFGLNEEQCAYLEAMSTEYRHFMLKRGSETIVAELNLGGMDGLLAVLSGNVEALAEQEAPEAAPKSKPTDAPSLAMSYGGEGAA